MVHQMFKRIRPCIDADKKSVPDEPYEKAPFENFINQHLKLLSLSVFLRLRPQRNGENNGSRNEPQQRQSAECNRYIVENASFFFIIFMR